MTKRAPRPRPVPTRPEVIRTRGNAEAAAQPAWRVFLEGLEVSASIGIHAHERETRQRILVDVELEMAGTPIPSEDRLVETADYEAIARRVEDLARAGHVQLVETLAERIATWCLKDERVTRVRVRVSKPEVLSNARGAGCEVVLTRS